MDSNGEIHSSTAGILAQHRERAPDGHNEAYEGGRQVGQVAGYILIGTIVLWGMFKYGAKLIKK